MADRGRGGPRQPQKPAAVSGPGALSKRTDGGAGSKSQPIRVPSGGKYGERKAATAQQQAAPLPVGDSPTQPQGVGGSSGGGGIFGPTERPNEMNDATGLITPQGNPLAANPQAALRVMFAQFPHPAIARLIDWSAVGNNEPR